MSVLLAAAAAGATALAWAVDRDAPADWAEAAGAALHWCASMLSALTWPVTGMLVVLSLFHYLASAGASRAAAGVGLPFRELFAAQFTASAANRLTPAGLGGAGVIGRFLVRRGGLAPAEATAAVSALGVLGALADVAVFGVLIGLGCVFGLAGAGAEVPALLSRLRSLVPIPGSNWRWLLLATGLMAAAVVALPSVRRSDQVRRATAGAARFGTTVRVLLAHPGRLAALMGASGGTTVALALGFAGTAVLGPTALPIAGFGALMIGYMVASAAGNALPTPGGIGTADAALVGVLLAAGAGAGAAVATVLAFRIVTFWAPAVVGLALARPLRRAGAL
jgi:uncharacterized membrane protein YbhN (UPF0104 family)